MLDRERRHPIQIAQLSNKSEAKGTGSCFITKRLNDDPPSFCREQDCSCISIEHSILACKVKVWKGRRWKRCMEADPSNLCWQGLCDCCGFGRLILGSTRRPGAPVRIRSIISYDMLPAVRDVGGHGLDPIQSVGDGGGGVRVRGRHHSPPQHRAQKKGDSKWIGVRIGVRHK